MTPSRPAEALDQPLAPGINQRRLGPILSSRLVTSRRSGPRPPLRGQAGRAGRAPLPQRRPPPWKPVLRDEQVRNHRNLGRPVCGVVAAARARINLCARAQATRHPQTGMVGPAMRLSVPHPSRGSQCRRGPRPRQHVVARRLSPVAPHGLRFGTILPQGDVGIRVVADRVHGFALALEQARPGGQTYPADSGDGGHAPLTRAGAGGRPSCPARSCR